MLLCPFEPRLGSFDPETTSPKMDLRPSIDAAGSFELSNRFLAHLEFVCVGIRPNLYQLQQNIDKHVESLTITIYYIVIDISYIVYLVYFESQRGPWKALLEFPKCIVVPFCTFNY